MPYFPVIDAIQEFKVVTNAPPAEFGRFNGGVINLSTKAGSNQLHGAAFEFLRNEALNARNLFAPSTAAEPRQAGVPPPPVRLRPRRTDREGPDVLLRGLPGNPAEHRARAHLDRAHRAAAPGRLHGGRRRAASRRSTIRPRRGPAPAAATTRDPFPGQHDPERTASTPSPPSSWAAIRCPTCPGTANNYRRVGNEDDDQDQFDVRVDHRASGARPALRPLQLLPRPDRPGDAAARRQRHPHRRARSDARRRGPSRPC